MRPFLTAEWRHLVMINYPVEPGLLAPYLPNGTELDFFEGETLLSLVGFLFLDTRVGGIPIPYHRNFEEINLRFYVRRQLDGEWRRGVVFIREIVPRWAVAAIARWIYRENYLALATRHTLDERQAAYGFRSPGGDWSDFEVEASGEAQVNPPGSEESFIAEHYWGYSAHHRGTIEYQVEHPPWRVWRAAAIRTDLRAEGIYPPELLARLGREPSSAFLAEGSPVSVYPGSRID